MSQGQPLHESCGGTLWQITSSLVYEDHLCPSHILLGVVVGYLATRQTVCIPRCPTEVKNPSSKPFCQGFDQALDPTSEPPDIHSLISLSNPLQHFQCLTYSFPADREWREPRVPVS